MRSDRYLELSLSYFYDRPFDRLKTALPGAASQLADQAGRRGNPLSFVIFSIAGRYIPCGTIAPN